MSAPGTDESPEGGKDRTSPLIPTLPPFPPLAELMKGQVNQKDSAASVMEPLLPYPPMPTNTAENKDQACHLKKRSQCKVKTGADLYWCVW